MRFSVKLSIKKGGMVEKSVSKSVSNLCCIFGAFQAKNERTAVASTLISLSEMMIFRLLTFTSRAPPGTTTRIWSDENLAQIARDANALMRKSSLIWTCTLLAGTIARSSDSKLDTAAKIAFFFSLWWCYAPSIQFVSRNRARADATRTKEFAKHVRRDRTITPFRRRVQQ